MASDSIPTKTGPKITGRCLCKSIKYSLTLPPLGTSICHCTYCQRTSGSALSANIYVVSTSFILDSGAEHLTEYVQVADSGDPIRRNFCKICGCFVFSREASGAMTMPSGGLDMDLTQEGEVLGMLRPGKEIFVQRRRPWLGKLQGAESWEEMWPGERAEA